MPVQLCEPWKAVRQHCVCTDVILSVLLIAVSKMCQLKSSSWECAVAHFQTALDFPETLS